MKEMDLYFHVPLDVDIQTVSDREINELLQEMSRNENNSELLKQSIYFFIEYYNKSVNKLFRMDYDELFVKDLLKDSKGNPVDSRELEMGTSLEKMRVEFSRFLMSQYHIDLKSLMEDESLRDRFPSFFQEFFRGRAELFVGNFNVDEVLHNISSYFYQYIVLKNRDVTDKESYQELYRFILNYDAQVLAKYNRLLNLEAKLAHTSRMVFMTIYNTKDMSDKLRELSVLSVMYHDIGRFYQALYYPNFMDSYVKNGELNGENNQLLESHAEVGYYFPMQNLITQDLIRSNGNIDEALVMHTLLSVVTKYHGKSNSVMKHYDVRYGDVSFDSSSILDFEKVLMEVFQKSSPIPVHARFDTLSNINHMQEFHNDIATYVIKAIVMISQYQKGNHEVDASVEHVMQYLEKFYKREVLEDLIAHPEKLEDQTVLESLFGVLPPEDFHVNSSKVDEDVPNRMQQMSQVLLSVDYAKTIDDLLAGRRDDIDISPEVFQNFQQVMGAIMTITTDMDKIDILNQRINGSWEKTNKSRFDREMGVHTELTREEVVDDFSRDTFFSEVDAEPCLGEEDKRKRGVKILQGNSTGNAIKSLWFHLDQFITINLRNYSSFELLKNGHYMEKIREHMIEEQDENKRELLIPLIDEPITFVNQFLDFVLSIRMDQNGNMIYPEFQSETGTYYCDDTLPKPDLFTGDQIALIRNIVVKQFKNYYHYEGNHPVDGYLPTPHQDDVVGKRYQ